MHNNKINKENSINKFKQEKETILKILGYENDEQGLLTLIEEYSEYLSSYSLDDSLDAHGLNFLWDLFFDALGEKLLTFSDLYDEMTPEEAFKLAEQTEEFRIDLENAINTPFRLLHHLKNSDLKITIIDDVYCRVSEEWGLIGY